MKSKNIRRFIPASLAAAMVTTVIICSCFVNANRSLTVQTAEAIDVTDKVCVPIIMYHHVLKKSRLLGRYCITPAEFESDLKYIKDNGYTTIVMQDLIDYCLFDAPLPEKPIMLTFDDGYESNYYYAFPLLQKYDMKAVISVVGYYSDKFSEVNDKHLNYSHLTWEEIKEMHDSGLVEIQNHSYHMHFNESGKRKGTTRLKGESIEDYTIAINEDIGRLQDRVYEKIGFTPTAFTYPFGAISKEEKDIIKGMGFLACLNCEEGINYLSGDENELFSLKRNNRRHNISSEAFFQKMYKRTK